MTKRIRFKLINGWKTWHKWWSTKFKVLSILALSLVQAVLLLPEHILFAWSIIPHDIKQTFPIEVTIGIGIFLIIASSVSQLIRQKKPHELAEREREQELSSEGNPSQHTSQPLQSDNYAQERRGSEEHNL